MKIVRALYLKNRLFAVIAAVILLFIVSFELTVLLPVAKLFLMVLLAILLVDGLLLFRVQKGIYARRICPDKLSNGDENELQIYLENYYNFRIHLSVIDELPPQFQKRDLRFDLTIKGKATKILNYHVRPVKRGEYVFGAVNVFVSSDLGLISRRFKFSQDKMVPVYPSFIQMMKYELLAISNHLKELGIKKIRRIGHSMEFEHIKEYVVGDDYRTVNWKATARRGTLMVNNYQDEKSQQVFCLIDKGRVMKMPFEGMTLLDYAINASLAMANIAIKKDEKAGLITFQHKINAIVPASKRGAQMYHIMETLYNQKTGYQESDYSVLYNTVKYKITHRSLLILFTNFETVSSMERQMPYLKKLAREHLLVVIFFENTTLTSLTGIRPGNIEEVYKKTIAEKFVFDKKLIVKELKAHGIQTVLTAPENLTVNTINKYLELKARGLI